VGLTTRAAKASAINSGEYDTNIQLWVGAAIAKTIATGAFAADVSFGSGAGRYVLTSETSTTDDLDTITGTSDGDIVILFAIATHIITLLPTGGNIRLGGGYPYQMTGPLDYIELRNVGGTLVGAGIHV